MAAKQLKTLVGRMVCYIERRLPAQPVEVQAAFQETLHKTGRILTQQPHDKNKPYSFHAPETECISKGR